jgi:hypothetical protein
MKNLFIAGMILVFTGVFITDCKKNIESPSNTNSNNSNNGNGVTDTTKPSAVGVPTGASISKFIPAAGGTITSADGIVEIDIPGGALPNGDTITIQNITNTIDNGPGNAYRFLPNGMKFASLVTIKFHYTNDDINGSALDFLGIAFQDSFGFWKPIPVSYPDTVNHIISGQTNHFTDFSKTVYGEMTVLAGSLIAGSPPQLPVNKYVTFVIQYADPKNVGHYSPFPKDWIIHPDDIRYAVNGIEGGDETNGTIVGVTNTGGGISGYLISAGLVVTYTAPSKIPDHNPVLLEVPMEAYIPITDSITGKRTGKYKYYKTTLQGSIKIIGGKVYRVDFVDWEDLGSGGTVNYYDSASVFFSMDQADPTKTVTVQLNPDSIENIPPVAWPTTPTKGAGNCTYTWIPEPIGTVNITSGSFKIYPYIITSTIDQYSVLVQLNNTNANAPWGTVACPGASGTVTQKQTVADRVIPIPPISIDRRDTDTTTKLLVGTFDKDHISLKLILPAK